MARPKALEYAVFFRTLSITFGAGLSLPKAMELMDRSLVGDSLESAARSVQGLLLQGLPLHEAMGRQSPAFTSLQIRLLQLGMETGSLPTALESLASYEEQRYAMNRRLSSALVYPLLVLVAALSFVLVVPTLMFRGLFQAMLESGQELSLLTRAVVGLSHLLSTPWSYVVGAALLMLLLRGVGSLWRRPHIRHLVHFWGERLPGLGQVLLSARLARFSSALSVVVESGFHLDRGLDLACRSCESALLEDAAPGLVKALQSGEPLSEALKESELFPKVVWQSLASGEESGKLQPTLDFLARFYHRDLEYRLLGFAALLEPLMLAGMGLLVGGLMMACIKPLAASFSAF